jgi:hypothetical protein
MNGQVRAMMPSVCPILKSHIAIPSRRIEWRNFAAWRELSIRPTSGVERARADAAAEKQGEPS